MSVAANVSILGMTRPNRVSMGIMRRIGLYLRGMDIMSGIKSRERVQVSNSLCVDCFINGNGHEEEADFVYNGMSRCAVHVKMAHAEALMSQEMLDEQLGKLKERVDDLQN